MISKDVQNKHLKIVPFLLVSIFIARQIREKQNEIGSDSSPQSQQQ